MWEKWLILFFLLLFQVPVWGSQGQATAGKEIEKSKLYTGTQRMLGDATAALQKLAVGIAVIVAIYRGVDYLLHKDERNQNDLKMQLIQIAAVLVGILLAVEIFKMIAGYYAVQSYF